MTTDYEDDNPPADVTHCKRCRGVLKLPTSIKAEECDLCRLIHERGVAEGIARERAAVVARVREQSKRFGGQTRDVLRLEARCIETGDHMPEHADALTRHDDRVRAEVLAGIIEARETYERGALNWRKGDVRDWLRQADIPGADALKRALAEAHEAGRREERARWHTNWSAELVGMIASERREAAAKAWEDASRMVLNNLGPHATAQSFRERAAALRAATGEGST